MYKKQVFRYSCFAFIFSFIVLLFTPFITGFLSNSIDYTEANKYGLATGVIAFFGGLISFLIAYSIYRQEHPVQYKNNLNDFDDTENDHE
ncbi:hypothetical protein SH1V18_03940 [Vallitalea longa]|uniref:Uncharacterized protein n=1 Tax=Vallitalea longa TaxID=2936439 RepID=A0A9W5Y7T9_9FIRM|nr:hypothetical protein [Vallitalea longa]GKX27914.1 hypothetical protein SH1V18_03940 [Vallitalea longa]